MYMPALGLWLDPHVPKTGSEKVFVSHAHSDHTAAHREVILSRPTSTLMQARVPGVRQEHVLDFGERKHFEDGIDYDLTLLPAGHIFGSAMALVEAGGQKLLYTGDFKLRIGLSAEKCQPAPADVLVMETTYGRPQYQFPPTEDVLKGVVRFCREALDNDETAVLLGYSLGKSQEILCSLGEAGLPLMLHGAIHRMTKIYERFGVCFPYYEPYEAAKARGKVLLCPPNTANSAMLRKLGRTRSAMLTGWAVDPSCRYRYQCDAAFPLSDHADFPDLVELVKRVQPKKVYTLHGFAADFAQTLRQLGFEATALSEDEQMVLDLGSSRGKRKVIVPDSLTAIQSSQENRGSCHGSTSPPFAGFAAACAQIGANSGKLEKIRVLSEYFRTVQGEAIGQTANWFSGRPFASSQNKVLQLGWAALRNALCVVGKIDEAAFHQIYLKHSDSGQTAFEILQQRQGGGGLSIRGVVELFDRLHSVRGPLVKTPILISALERATPLEGKFLVKIITGDLRIGLKEGLVEDAIALAFGQPAADIRQANLLVGDIGETALLAATNRLSEASLSPFRPLKLMLASPEETATDIWQRVCEWNRTVQSETPGNGALPETAPEPVVWIEDKYDGIRCQLHKSGPQVSLYSRDLKDISATFPELCDSVRSLTKDFILDGEIVAMRGNEILPFAELQKRLGRKGPDLFMREEVPIKFIAFDLLWLSGRTLLKEPLAKRRQALEQLPALPDSVRLAQITTARSIEEIEAAFSAARLRDNEGLMIKEPASLYLPGRRGLAWLKLKKPFATLDCVVIGAEYGHGKRSKVLSDYTFAVRDDGSGELKTIGKAYSGLTDVEIAGLTEHFLKTATRQHGRYFEVAPDTVLEIAFDRIQPSKRHSSGLALRFPRIARIRTDKPVEEIDTLESARKLAGIKETKVTA